MKLVGNNIEIATEIAFFEPGDGKWLLGRGVAGKRQNGDQVPQDQLI